MKLTIYMHYCFNKKSERKHKLYKEKMKHHKGFLVEDIFCWSKE